MFDLHTLEHARGQHSDLSSSSKILTLGDLIHPPGFNTINFDDYRMHLCSLDLAQLQAPLECQLDNSNLTRPKSTGFLLPHLLLSGLLRLSRRQLRFTKCRRQAPSRYALVFSFTSHVQPTINLTFQAQPGASHDPPSSTSEDGQQQPRGQI